MNASLAGRRIALVVTNPQILQRGSTPRHSFDSAGGTIGCRGANWILADAGERIQPIHCEILQADGAFCVVARAGQTRINDGADPIAARVSVCLTDNDILHIGPYRIAVHLHDQQHALPDSSRHLAQYEVGELLNEQQDTRLDELPATPLATEGEPRPSSGDAAFQALAAPLEPRDDLDPLLALDAAERTAVRAANSPDPLAPMHDGIPAASTQADLAATRFEAVTGSPKPLSGDRTMSQPRDRSTLSHDWLAAQQTHGGDPARLAAPLLQGLGAPLGPLDAQASYSLLLEAGQALNAAIRGIAELYGSQAGSHRRLAPLGRTLQPIEDNPLRLGQSYPETVHALFSSERSVVHLSPGAAIDESLTQIRQHHGAVITAIGASLDALLRAFAPDLLLERFRRYQPDQAAQPHTNDWAWQMYTHYYNELTSPRQQGFEKLFWEVFEQAYDRALRSEAP